MAASRPVPGNPIKEIYSFEVLSSTEWSFPLRFSPNTFVDIDDFVDIKLKAMKAYSSELRDFPQPRSLKGIELNAKMWGIKTGLDSV